VIKFYHRVKVRSVGWTIKVDINRWGLVSIVFMTLFISFVLMALFI
jgi:hypothetical protein